MLELLRGRFGSFELVVSTTEADDGDMTPGAAGLRRRQVDLTGRPWWMVAEEHGVGVVDVDVDVDAGPARPTIEASVSEPTMPPLPGDVLVTCARERAVAVWAADCAPVVLCGRHGTLVAVHAGWRGLAAGVIDVAVGELAMRGDTVSAAVLGPHIHAECYAFGSVELLQVARGVGVSPEEIASTTSDGQAALDVSRAVAASLLRHDIELVVVGGCTSCDGRWFSHRARTDTARQALVAWTTLSS